MSATISANPTNATTATAAGGTASSPGLASNFNTFLTLLTTQLQNQDPTQPMDTNQMTEQLVQFASVEQQIDMNTNMQKLISLQQATTLTTATPMIGKQVEVDSTQLSLQNGTATLRLPPAGAATTATVTILDAGGQTLKTATVTLGSGTTDWPWNGKNNAGTTMPDGAYSFAVAGADASGNPQSITATVVAKATAVERQSTTTGTGDLQLMLGSLAVSFDAVRSLGQ